MTTAVTRFPADAPFAARLAALRAERGWSQQDVATGLNGRARQRGRQNHVTVNTVSRWERGLHLPDPLNRQLLAELFGLTLRELGLVTPAPAPPAGGLPLPPLTSSHNGLDPKTTAAQQRWQSVRRALNRHRLELSRLAAELHQDAGHPVGPGPLLATPGWLLDAPVPLERVRLSWVPAPPAARVTGTGAQAAGVLPPLVPGRRYQRYAHALRDLDPPRLLENRPAYRPLGWDPRQPALACGPVTYFELLDLAEALAHELAAAHLLPDLDGHARLRRGSWARLPLRQRVSDPFDLAARPAGLSIDTLTLRRTRDGASFVLHQRDPGRVAVCGGTYHVMPAGVFQPATLAPGAHPAEFDLWRSVQREYAEEFLGDLDCDGNRTSPLDDADREPFRTLERARRHGRVRAWLLGLGLDPLTLWGELLTVVVIDAEVFDTAFRELVPVNQEGVVVRVAGRSGHGVPFTEERVQQVTERMAPAAAAALELAWRHRDLLLA